MGTARDPRGRPPNHLLPLCSKGGWHRGNRKQDTRSLEPTPSDSASMEGGEASSTSRTAGSFSPLTSRAVSLTGQNQRSDSTLQPNGKCEWSWLNKCRLPHLLLFIIQKRAVVLCP